MSLNNDMLHGVFDVHGGKRDNSLSRCHAVMAQAANVQPSGVLSRYARVPVKQELPPFREFRSAGMAEKVARTSEEPMPELFNSPLETGVRAVVVLDAVFPRSLDVGHLTWCDHLVVHTADIGRRSGQLASGYSAAHGRTSGASPPCRSRRKSHAAPSHDRRGSWGDEIGFGQAKSRRHSWKRYVQSTRGICGNAQNG